MKVQNYEFYQIETLINLGRYHFSLLYKKNRGFREYLSNIRNQNCNFSFNSLYSNLILDIMKLISKLFTLSFALITCSLSVFGQTSFLPNSDVKVIRNSDTLMLPWAGGLNFGQISTIDLNLDGVEDLIVFDRSDYRVHPFVNIGSPGHIKFRYAPEYSHIFPKSIGWMLLRDYNCDGKKDVFYSSSGGVLSVSKNISTTKLAFDLVNDKVESDQYPGGNIGIYIPSSDIPAIGDVDHDGDIDIITFGVLGTSLEFHRNYGIENYATCDSIDFTLKNYCWGHFQEIGVNTNKLILLDTCNFNVPNPESTTGGGSGSSRHVGSTVTMFDNNGDSVIDLLLGDVTFNNIVMAQNGGTAPNQNTSMSLQDTAFPSYGVPIDLTLFPGTFLEDIDNDGIKDLIASPNTSDLAQNYESMWYYKNLGTNNIPNFEFIKKDLLQDEMIELGENSIPELFDYNADGLLDLVVSSYGYFNRDSITYDCKISLYKNVGTTLNPMFEFITEDYQNIAALKLGNSLHPTFGDLDGDGDEEMILGNSEGYLHLFDNTAGAGNTANFTIASYRLQDNNGDTIDVGQFSAPQLFDYDNDGDLDLVIGKVNGSIRYYKNIGTTSAYSFQKITDSMGKVEIHEPWDLYGAATGYCTPKFVRDGSTVTLYSGSQQGGVYSYSGINTANPFQTYIIDTVMPKEQNGFRTVPVLYDFKNDGNMDMILGNVKGGLNFYTMGVGYLGVDKNLPEIDFGLFPNPTSNIINIQLDQSIYRNNTMKIHNLLGELIEIKTISTSKTIIDVSNYPKGLYLITINSEQGNKTKRFIVQ